MAHYTLANQSYLFIELSHVGRCRPLGWDPRDDSSRWLGTLKDMDQNRLHWKRTKIL